jgi:hypothetical protein
VIILAFFFGNVFLEQAPTKKKSKSTKDFLTTTASKIKIQRNIFEP